MEGAQYGGAVPALSGWLERRVAGEDAAEEGHHAGGPVATGMVADGACYAYQQAKEHRAAAGITVEVLAVGAQAEQASVPTHSKGCVQGEIDGAHHSSPGGQTATGDSAAAGDRTRRQRGNKAAEAPANEIQGSVGGTGTDRRHQEVVERRGTPYASS